MHAVAGRGGRLRVECQGRSKRRGIEFQGVETGIDRDGRSREVVAELRAFIRERAGIAPRSDWAEIAETRSAALAADKPSVVEIIARGKIVPCGSGAAAEGQQIAIRIRAIRIQTLGVQTLGVQTSLAPRHAAAEPGLPARSPGGHGIRLGLVLGLALGFALGLALDLALKLALGLSHLPTEAQRRQRECGRRPAGD